MANTTGFGAYESQYMTASESARRAGERYGYDVPLTYPVALYATKELGTLTVQRLNDLSRGYIILEYKHVALDLHVSVNVDARAVSGLNMMDLVDFHGKAVEAAMLKMLRDKINPPPKPAPAPMYAVQQSSGAAASYLGAASHNSRWTWNSDVANARLFASQAAATRFLSECVTQKGSPFSSDVTIVRVDVLTQTLEKRVATVLK